MAWSCITEVHIKAFDGTEDDAPGKEGWYVNVHPGDTAWGEWFGPFKQFEAACSHASSCRGGPSLVDENGRAYAEQGRLL